MLNFDGSQARAELKFTKTAHDQLKAGAKGAASAHGQLDVALDQAGAAAAGGAARARTLATAEQQLARSAKAAAQGHTLAAGSIANLTAQFNDMVIMMMAGQNPFQLAAQQGTQITQVIGPMGATGAVRALGSAFVQMINPVSLITIGSITAGAAMIQWLTGADEDARSLEDSLSDLSASVSDYRDLVEQTKVSQVDLYAQFGSGADAARETLERLADAQERVARGAIGDTIGMMLDETGVDYNRPEFGDLSRAGREFGFGSWSMGLGGDRHELRGIVADVMADYSALEAVADAAIGDQIAAVDALYQSFERAARASGDITAEEGAQLQLLAEIQKSLLEQQAIEEIRAGRDAAARAEFEQMTAEMHQQAELAAAVAIYGADSTQAAELRLAHERAIVQARLDQLNIPQAEKDAALATWEEEQRQLMAAEAYARQVEEADKLSAIRARDVATLNRMLTQMQQQNQMMTLIAAHGEDSAEVAAARTRIERANLEAMLAESDAGEDIKDAIRGAWAEGQRLNATNMSDGLADARAEAQELADQVLRAVAGVQALQAQAATSIADAQIRLDNAGDPVATARALGVARMTREQELLRDGASVGEIAYLDTQAKTYGDQMAQLAQLDQDRLQAVQSMSGSGGGGGSSRSGRSSQATAANREREAVERLITSLTDELAILRETDPVAREMIKHRDDLKGATEAEREAVRQLIETRQAEEQQLQAMNDQQQFYRDTVYGAFDGLVLRGQSVVEVLGNIAAAAAQAFAQAALLGQGPLAGLFGTTPGVGLLNLIFPGVGGMATGGMVYGPGSGTSDSVPTMLSAGEFVVNAAATRDHRALLEMINGGGEVLRMAQGGHVGTAPAYSAPQISVPVIGANEVAAPEPAPPATVVVRLLVSPQLRAEMAETAQGVTVELLEAYDRDVAPGTLERVSGDVRRRG